LILIDLRMPKNFSLPCLKYAMLTWVVCQFVPALAATTASQPKTLHQIMAPGKSGFDPARHGDVAFAVAVS
jgi:hypothetical protein